MLDRISNGRTDLVFDFVESGNAVNSTDPAGVSLIAWCAYYGDVSAIRFLLSKGESLRSLGETALNAAAFHGHWQLCEFLLENGADPNLPLVDTGETPLHAALCTSDRATHDVVVGLLLAKGADPHAVTKPAIETGGFMRDSRTRGETPLHRAAAFGTEETIDLLLAADASREVKDMNGDTPLTWASWYLRPTSILRKLCYGEFAINPARKSMRVNLIGRPWPPARGAA